MIHDPGGKSRLKLASWVLASDAMLNPNGQHRFWLMRRWDCKNFPYVGDYAKKWPPYALWCGLNPSTADATVDDPTCYREALRTRSMGLECYVKINLMTYRATRPRSLPPPPYCWDPACREIVAELVERANVVVAAWGIVPPRYRGHETMFLGLCQAHNKRVLCLGRTKDGFPRHPLYIRLSQEFVPFMESV